MKPLFERDARLARSRAEENRILELAGRHPLLAVLEPFLIRRMISASRFVVYRENRPVRRAGDPPRYVLCLLSGALRVFHRRYDSATEVLVNLMRAPAIVGATEVIAGTNVNEHVSTLEKSEILFVRAELFLSLLKQEEKFAELVTLDLSVRLWASSGQRRALAFSDLDKRLADLLLDYVEIAGAKHEAGIVVQLSLSQQALASDLGVSRKALALSLRKLKDEGIIDKVDARYLVKDLSRLRDASSRVPGLVHELGWA